MREEWGVEPLRIREGGVRPSSPAAQLGANQIFDPVCSLHSLPRKRICLSRSPSAFGSKHGT